MTVKLARGFANSRLKNTSSQHIDEQESKRDLHNKLLRPQHVQVTDQQKTTILLITSSMMVVLQKISISVPLLVVLTPLLAS